MILCTGSAHGTTYRAWAGCLYAADASPLACCLADRDLAVPPVSQTITRRRWTVPVEIGYVFVDDAGNRFY